MPQTIESSVTIEYKGSKADNIIRTAKLVNNDLLCLKLPCPKKDNVAIWPPRSLKLVWPTEKGSVLHGHLTAKTSSDYLKSQRPLLELLEISQITYEQNKVLANPAQHAKNQRNHQRTHPYEQSKRTHLAPMKGAPPGADFPTGMANHHQVTLPNRPQVESLAPTSQNYLHQVKQEEPCSPPLTLEPPHSLINTSQFDHITNEPLPSDPQSGLVDAPSHPPAPPKPTDSSVINQLTRELWDVRRELAAGLAREHNLLQKLGRLNAPAATTSLVEGSSRSNDIDESRLRPRLQLVEREWAEERRKRKEMEAILGDISRERKEPFIVPALLDAFVAVSKLTTGFEDSS